MGLPLPFSFCTRRTHDRVQPNPVRASVLLLRCALMKPSYSQKLLCLISAIACVALAVTSCGKPAATEPVQESPVMAPTATPVMFESPLSPPATLPPLVPESGLAGAYGVLVSSPSDWAGQPLYCWFAPFYESSESDGGGFFLLEPAEHPNVQLEADGSFRLGTIPPGEYVVVVGPSPDAALAIQDARGPRVLELAADEALDLGDIHLDQ